MAKIEDTIAALEAKLKQAKALKQKQEAQKKAREQKLTRAQDTRRKILVGSLFLQRASSSDAAQAELKTMLDPFLTRLDDRALFGLEVSGEAIYRAVTQNIKATFEKHEALEEEERRKHHATNSAR